MSDVVALQRIVDGIHELREGCRADTSQHRRYLRYCTAISSLNQVIIEILEEEVM